MSILFLTSDDFQLRTGDRGAMLCLKNSHEYPGLALVLYYSNDCPYCGPVITKFKELPSLVTGCTFAMCNVSHAMDVVETSKNTISPIRYVPDLVLFVNGAPFMRYDGQQEVAAIQNFLHDVYNKLQHKTAFAANEGTPHHFSPTPTTSKRPAAMAPPASASASPETTPPAREIPEYTIGKPLLGQADRCYFSFDKAYGAPVAV